MKHKPIYLLLFPLFFVLHGFRENYDFVPLPDAIKLTAIYLLATGVIFTIGWLILRNLRQAALLTFCLLAIHFFLW